MTHRSLAVAAPCLVVGVALFLGYQHDAEPLWPGSQFTVADRERALRHGLDFLFAQASRPEVFHDWGHDLLSAFVNLGKTSGDREFSDLALRMGHERALEWHREHPRVPAHADADEIADLVYGYDAAASLGVPDEEMRRALRAAAARFSAVDYLGFDPPREPPPAKDRYDVFQDALIVTYTGDHYGVTLGAHLADVLRWLPLVHPYPPRSSGEDAYYHSLYTVTHVVYTSNGYNTNRLAPRCFPLEFAYLKDNFPQAVADRDPETLGEYMDTLQSFGLAPAHPWIRRGVEYLLSVQNPDGSWGDTGEKDPYVRYHSTWTGLNGIQSFRWGPVLPCAGR